MSRKAILLHVKDNVATALTNLKKGEQINASLDEVSADVTLHEDIDFAHKYALRNIAKGEEVIKYGMPIGKALSDIRAGDWVHIHNCRSQRHGSYDLKREKYIIKGSKK